MAVRKGRPRHKPTDEQRRQVMTMIGLGLTQTEVANLVGISDRTLRVRYRRELDTGVSEANLRVAQSLFNMAVREKVPAAAIWWTKARMGWRGVGDPAGDMPLQVDFRWADAPLESSGIKSAAPTIDAETETEVEDAGGDLVVWQGDATEAGN